MADFLKKYMERQELVKEFGFKTMDDFKDNFIYHHDPVQYRRSDDNYREEYYISNQYPYRCDPFPYVSDYIMLKKPIHGITMIHKSKDWWFRASWDEAVDYAEKLAAGGFNDWYLPLREELETLSKIKVVRGLGGDNGYFWSYSTTSEDMDWAWAVSFYTGKAKKLKKSCWKNLLCVRVISEESVLHREESKKLLNLYMNEKLAAECGFDILDDFRTNFIDRGDYIELKKPVGDISMIQKCPSELEMTLDDAVKYSARLNLGGFDGWRLPTIEDIEILHKICNVCGISGKLSSVWVSPWNSRESYFARICDGKLWNSKDSQCFKTRHVRCVR
ncbi:DUF1566 domain-containing protein [bacterium]|nr:DUF1566 domain-containing protein [bacterium]